MARMALRQPIWLKYQLTRDEADKNAVHSDIEVSTNSCESDLPEANVKAEVMIEEMLNFKSSLMNQSISLK